MPELPEVETLRRELQKHIVGKKIKSAKVLWPKTVLPLLQEVFEKEVKNETIARVGRQAKMLILDLADDTALVVHLKMTGQLIYEETKGKRIAGGHPDKSLAGKMPNSFTRLILSFTDGSTLYFNDMRKFGWVRLVRDEELKNLPTLTGVEPLSKKFTTETLANIFRRYPNRTIKQTLLDQTLVAGLGNIYVDEATFLAKLSPTRKNSSLKKSDVGNLHQAVIKVLKLSIQKKGTSSRNYARLNGKPGGFVPHLNVYGRAGQPCKVCGTPIEKIKHAGRGTHYCPQCQK